MGTKSIIAISLIAVLLIGAVSFDDAFAKDKKEKLTKLQKECAKEPKKENKIKANCELLEIINDVDVDPSGDSFFDVFFDVELYTVDSFFDVFTDLQTDVVQLFEDLAAEAATRLAADDQLQSQLDDEIADRIADVDEEQARAEAAESDLQSQLDDEIADRIADVDEEQARAEAAESDLQSQLGDEATARSDKDMLLMNEDDRLQGAIDTISLIQGPKGDKGDKGGKGDKGDTGAAGTTLSLADLGIKKVQLNDGACKTIGGGVTSYDWCPDGSRKIFIIRDSFANQGAFIGVEIRDSFKLFGCEANIATNTINVGFNFHVICETAPDDGTRLFYLIVK